jgi:hypothetical protein
MSTVGGAQQHALAGPGPVRVRLGSVFVKALTSLNDAFRPPGRTPPARPKAVMGR